MTNNTLFVQSINVHVGVEKKPGGKKSGRKNGSGKKAWWKESLVYFGKDGKKSVVYFF